MPTASILDAWLAKLGQPVAAADPFRDPVAHTYQEALPVLIECILGRAPFEAAAEPLERLIRIRAVQDIAPSEAVAFLLDLKPLLDSSAHAAIDRMALAAFDRYTACREELHAIQLREIRRRSYVAERMGA